MTIGEFSEKTGMSCSTLRFYENKGLLRVSRDAANRRIYSEFDVEWVKFLNRLKYTGMTLEKMKIYSDLRYAGDATLGERLKILEEHKIYVAGQVEKWLMFQNNLNEKIELYREKLKP